MTDAPTVGIIGLGIGRAHVRAFQVNKCAIVGICQRDEAAARKVAERAGVPASAVFTRWQDMIEKARPQAVVIATPPHLHREIALAVFAAGAHVLCEKPLAMTRAEARDMVAAAARHGKVGMTCFNWRYPAAMQALHERLGRGEVGRTLHANARWYGAAFADETIKATWRANRLQAGHGAMGDMGVHAIDLVRWNLGPIARVLARPTVAYPQRSAPGINAPADADDQCVAILELASGQAVTLEVSRVAHGMAESRFEVFGTDGALAYRLLRTAPRWYDGELGAAAVGKPIASVDLSAPALDPAAVAGDGMEALGGSLMAAMAREFLAAVRDGKTRSPSFEDGLAAQAVLDAVLESSQRRAWVDVASPLP
jgi:predicted dehydrogenase